MQKPDLLRPTLLAGVLFGVASGIPGLNVGNCCCCLWLWAAGWLAAMLYIREGRRTGYPCRVSDGAMAGLVAGLFGGFSAWTVEMVVNLLFGEQLREFAQSMVESILKSMEGFPPEMERAIMQAFEQQTSIFRMVFALISSLFFFSLLSTLAGVLTAALMDRGSRSPIAPPPPPQPSGWGAPGTQGWGGSGPPSDWGPAGPPGTGSPQEPPVGQGPARDPEAQQEDR